MKYLAIITIAWCALARVAHADDRSIGHVVTAPTAWLPTTLTATAGLDQKLGSNVALGVGLGGLAAVELDDDTDVRACGACTDPTTRAEPIHLRRATFKMGLRPNRYFRYQPALLVGFRKSWRGADNARVAELWGVMSEDLGPVRLHVGVMATSATDADVQLLHAKPSAFGGIEWTPPQYPRTSLIGDLVWVPELTAKPRLEYITGLAARYQAFSWGSIELGVRHRQDDGIGDAEFFARLNLLAR